MSKCKSGLGWRWEPSAWPIVPRRLGPGYHLPVARGQWGTGQAAVAGLLVEGGGQGSVSTAAGHMRARPACFWLEGGRLMHESQAWRLRRAWDEHCVLSPSWGTSIRLPWGSGPEHRAAHGRGLRSQGS